jgi:hypothetical protein
MEATAIQNRDEGIRKVSGSNRLWMASAVAELVARYATTGTELTGEDMREYVTKEIGTPSHPNAWGALVKALIRGGWIKDTFVTAQMTSPQSHARRTPLWRFE